MFKAVRILALVVASGLSAGAMAAVQTVALDVPGMTCSSCPITIKQALKKVDGVTEVKASFAKREAIVTFDDSKTSIAKLTAATTNAGYPSTLKVAK